MELTQPKDFQNASELLDLCFPVEDGNHFTDDFPIWKTLPRSDMRLFGITEGDRLIATAGARACENRVHENGSVISMGMIGAVATHPEHRNKGLASKAVREALEWLERKGTRLQFLWGAEHELYEKFGFELGGKQIHAPIECFKFGSSPSSASNFKINQGYHNIIFDLILHRPSGIRYSEQDRLWWTDHPNVRWMTLEDPATRTFAYVGIGRGIDLKDTIHEWGGNTPLLSGLLNSLQKTHPELSMLVHPSHLKKNDWEIDPRAEAQSLALIRNPNQLPIDDFWIWGLDAI